MRKARKATRQQRLLRLRQLECEHRWVYSKAERGFRFIRQCSRCNYSQRRSSPWSDKLGRRLTSSERDFYAAQVMK